MQSPQIKKKFAISFGIVVTICAIGSIMILPSVISHGTDTGLLPAMNEIPVPENNVPEMIVNKEISVSGEIPVPENNMQEIFVSGNSISMIRNYPN